jgi:hypothetical protein
MGWKTTACFPSRSTSDSRCTTSVFDMDNKET